MDNKQPAGELRRLDALFGAALYRVDCPTSERLLEYAANILAPGEAQTIAAHLADCAHCRSELALISAPPAVRPTERRVGFSHTLIRAVLQPAAAVSLRGLDENIFRYDAGVYQVLVAFTPPPALGGPGQIDGLLLGEAATGLAELLQGDTLVETSELDAVGFFAFDAVASGAYTIRLTLDVELIVIDQVQFQ